MTLYVGCALIICFISSFLVWHKEYEDGVFGRLALAALAIANGLTVYAWMLEGSNYTVLPATLATQIATAGFLVRHCWRFLRWKDRGDHDWRSIKK